MFIKPLRTEKTLKEAASGRYAFAVDVYTTKTAIRHLVTKLFGVDIIKVQTSIVPGKTYRTGKKGLQARLSDWKKATVTVKSGQRIDLFEASA